MLACGVSTAASNRSQALRRTDVNDVPLLASEHGRQHGRGHLHEAGHIGLYRSGPLVDIAFMERLASANIAAGVIHQNIDRLPVLGQSVRQAGGRYGVGHIQLYGQARSRQFIELYLQALKSAGAADDPRSCMTQHAGSCKANARTGSGHEGCFSLEGCHWYLLIWAVV